MRDSPIDREALRRMREIIATAIASRRTSVAEAAAEARGLGVGLQPALPVSTIDAAVGDLLREFGAWRPKGEVVEAGGHWLQPAEAAEVADTLAYAMRFDHTGKARRTGAEVAAKLAAEQLVQQLLASGFVVMRRAPPVPDRTEHV